MASDFRPLDYLRQLQQRRRLRAASTPTVAQPTTYLPPEPEPLVPESPGIADYVANIARGAYDVFIGTPMRALNLPKEASEHVARKIGTELGLNIPEDWTYGKMLEEALLPFEQGRGGLLDYAPEPTKAAKYAVSNIARAAGAHELARQADEQSTLLDNPYARAVLSGGIKFAGELVDPLMPVALAGPALRGPQAAAKLLARQPGLALYAPEVAAALRSAIERPAVTGGIAEAAQRLAGQTLPRIAGGAVELSPGLRRAASLAERAPGLALGGSMLAGGVQQAGEAGIEAWAGGLTPEVVQKGVEGLLAGATGAAVARGTRTPAREQAKVVAGSRAVRPTRLLPIDELPDELQRQGEYQAREMAKAMATGKSAEEVGILPEALQPWADPIYRQATEEAKAIREGFSFLERLRSEHQSGEPGVSVEPGPGGPNESMRLIQRDKQGNVVGGADITGDRLNFIAGGDSVGSKVKADAIYDKLDELGIDLSKNLEELSALGALARRRRAEKQLRLPREVLEGRQTGEELVREATAAREEMARAGLSDLVGVPAYAAEGAPHFYSQLRRVVSSPKTQDTQRGGDWLRFFADPKRGVKAAEMKWTGLDDYLKSRSGERVTRADINQFLDENEVQVDEAGTGANDAQIAEATKKSKAAGDSYVEAKQALYDILLTGPERMRRWDPSYPYVRSVIASMGSEQAAAVQRFKNAADAADDAFNALERLKREDGTKYEHWTEPGGTNYRELKITQKTKPKTEERLVQTYENLEEANAAVAYLTRLRRSGDKDDRGLTYHVRPSAETPGGFEVFWRGPARQDVKFKSQHYDEPNILAHVRFKDDVGPNGERVLRVEEIQSDWAELGRDLGFQQEGQRSTDEIDRDMDAVTAELERRDPLATFGSHPDLHQRYQALQKERNRSKALQAAPFVEKTNEWTDLAVKRLLKYAADNGYDKIAWTPGDVQNRRYGMSQHVEGIQYDPGEQWLTAVRKGGEIVIDERVLPEELPGKIGKELAVKLLKSEPVFDSATEREIHALEGLDLEVGGEGMRAYYDEMVPQSFSRIAKKFGGQVGKTVLMIPSRLDEQAFRYEGPQHTYNSIQEWWQDASQGFDVPVDILEQARAVSRSMLGPDSLTFERAMQEHGSGTLARALGGKFVRTDVPMPREWHSVDVPKEARERISSEGMPLFKADQEGTGEAAKGMQDLLLKLYPENSKIKVNQDGSFAVTLPNKRVVVWRPGVDHIELDLSAYEKGYGKKAAAGTTAKGVTYRLPNAAIVEIVKGANARVPLHEHWHVVKHLGQLNDKQLATLKKRFKNEEAEADAYADWFESGMKKPDTIWKRIAQGVRNVYDVITSQPGAVFRQATKEAFTGDPDGRWGKAWGEEGPLAKVRNLKDGARVVGSPPGVVDMASFRRMRESVKQMAIEGEPARPWYRRSSQMILDAVQGDKRDAEKLAQLIAIYSPQTNVPQNYEAAIRAWNQYKSGAKQITAGRNRSQDRVAERLLFNNENWDGRKTNNFYGNLMLQIDPTNPALKDLVTIDIHMMRALGYPTNHPGDAQYSWAEKLFKDLADELGWEPHEVQAAVWTSQKYRREVLSKLKPGEPRPPVVSFDFDDAARSLAGKVDVGAVPHLDTGVLPELAGADYATRAAYVRGMRDTVLLDQNGNDRIARLFGLVTRDGFLSPERGQGAETVLPREPGGIYAAFREMGFDGWDISRDLRKATPEQASEVAANGYAIDHQSKKVYVDPRLPEAKRQLQAVAALGELAGDPQAAVNAIERARDLDPGTVSLIRRYAAALGYVLRQGTVGYGRTFLGQKKSEANAYHIDLGRQLTDVEGEQLMAALANELGTSATDARLADVFQKSTRNGVTLVNFSDLPNEAFLDAAHRARHKLYVDEAVNSGYAIERGGRVSNDWAAHPKGDSYVQEAAGTEASAAGAPSVLRGLQHLRQEADAFNKRFAAAQGWGEAAYSVETGGLREVDPASFLRAKSGSTRPGFLSSYTEQALAGKRLFLSPDEKVGYLLDGQGDLGNLFNTSERKGAGREALLHAIEHGALTLDAFDGYLPRLYAQYGFVPTGAMRWNDAYAPDGWDYARDGRPDVIFMAYRGGDPASLRQRIGSFPEYAHPGNYLEDFDAAKSGSRRAALDESERAVPGQEGGPRLDPAYATAPGTPPGPDPMGQPKPAGEPPRVETRVENLEDAVREQRQLGLNSPDLNLSRIHRRTWKSLDPEVRKLLSTWDDAAMLKIAQRRSLDDVEVMALDAVVRGRREQKDLARLDYIDAQGTPGEDAAWRKYAQALAAYVPMEMANVNDGTGTARALAARARLMEAAQTKDRQFLRQVFREMPGIDEQSANEMLRMFETGDPRLADAIRAATAGRWKQWQTLLRAFLITPSSEIANGIGNTIVQGVELADAAAASGVDWVISALRGTNRERTIGEVGAELGGMMDAVPSAMKAFLNERFVQIYKRAWKGESRQIKVGKVPLEHQVSPFKSKLGRLFATSLDALQSGDELFQAPIATGELAKRAYRMAKAELPQGSGLVEIQARANEIMAEAVNRPEAHEKLLNEVRSAVDRRLFRDKPWGVVNVLKDMERRWPWMTAVLPFVKTPANIARYAIHHSPLGMASPEFGRAVLTAMGKGDGSLTQGQAADIIGRRIVGTAVFAMAVGAAKMKKLTGSGPADPEERKALEQTGWRPYSIVVNLPTGKVYVPYNRFDPVAQMVGVAADIVELPDMRDASDVVSKAIGSVSENFTNRTYLKGVMDFTEALNDPLRFLGNYAIGIGEMHIPRQVARIAQAIDPVLRDVRPVDKGMGGFMDRVIASAMRNVPGLSDNLPARYSATGEPVVRPGEGIPGALMRTFSPVQISQERQGRNLEALMAQIGYVPPEARSYMTIQGKQIHMDREQIELLHRADRAAAYELRRLLMNPLFSRLPDSVEEGGNQSKEGLIRKTYDKHRDLARQEIMRSWKFQQTAREQLRRSS